VHALLAVTLPSPTADRNLPKDRDVDPCQEATSSSFPISQRYVIQSHGDHDCGDRGAGEEELTCPLLKASAAPRARSARSFRPYVAAGRPRGGGRHRRPRSMPRGPEAHLAGCVIGRAPVAGPHWVVRVEC
jgi:hypothetical protein